MYFANVYLFSMIQSRNISTNMCLHNHTLNKIFLWNVINLKVMNPDSFITLNGFNIKLIFKCIIEMRFKDYSITLTLEIGMTLMIIKL